MSCDAQWARLGALLTGWLPVGGLPWGLVLLVFLLGAGTGAGLTMLAHPHAWCARVLAAERRTTPQPCWAPLRWA